MASKTNKDFFFCSAPERPKNCQYGNNKCCHNCDKNNECFEFHRAEKSRPLPCVDMLEENETCEFQI